MTLMNYLEDCPSETSNYFLSFSVCELDLNDLREINVWQFDNEKFGLGQPMEIEYSIMKLETE